MPDDEEKETVAEVDLDEAAASPDPPPAPGPGSADPDDAGPVGAEPVDVDPVDASAVDEGPIDPDDIDLPTALAQRDDYLALARRVQADFENFRKRTIKQGQESAAYATGRLVESLLPVLDACDAAIIHGVDGVAPIHKALFDALNKAGLEVVATDGVPFDPNEHEAVLHEPGDGGEAIVVDVLRTGYRWNGRVLRAAMVKVKD